MIIITNTGHELMFNRPDEIVCAVDLAWQMADEAILLEAARYGK